MTLFNLHRLHTAQETAISRNPPTYNLKEGRKHVTDTNRPAVTNVMFLRKYKEKQFLVNKRL